MTKIQIKNRWTGTVQFETDAESIGAAIIAALLAKADLREANLSGADLRGADLTKKELDKISATRTILPEGDLVGWKKLQEEIICKLLIPAKAKRVGGLIGRKCRAEYAVVVEGNGKAIYDGTNYKVGDTIRPDAYDPNPLVECSNGIHFMITRQEAEDYQ
jgi:hypothetical protein